MTDPFKARALLMLARQAENIRLHGSLEAYDDYLYDLCSKYRFPVERGGE